MKGLWPRLGRGVSRHPRWVWVVCAVVLLAASAGLLQLKASGTPQSAVVEGYSQARDGQTALGKHFPQGSGSPAVIVADQGSLQDVANKALDTSGVSSVTVLSSASPSGSYTVTKAGIQPLIPGVPAGAPTVYEGKVLLQATLSKDPDSVAAQKVVEKLRTQRREQSGHAIVGGTTATAIDTNAAAVHDRDLIIPVVLLVILIVLMLLLRSIVAPLLLIGSVVLSFSATIGISALVFNHVFRFVGADPAVPLYGFIFLVALGVDYNIFLMTRVREESGAARHPRRCHPGSRDHGRRHHFGRHRARGHLRGARGHPGAVPQPDRVHRRLRRAARHDHRAVAARARPVVRHRSRDLVAVEAGSSRLATAVCYSAAFGRRWTTAAVRRLLDGGGEARDVVEDLAAQGAASTRPA